MLPVLRPSAFRPRYCSGSASGASGLRLSRPATSAYAVSAASGPVRRGLGCRSGCPKASFADRRLPSGGSVIAMVGCHSSRLPYPKIWPVPVISLPPERSSLGSPFAASAVRLAHSGGNLPHAFSDTAAGFTAVSSGCNFSFDFNGFPSISPVRNALPITRSCAHKVSRATGFCKVIHRQPTQQWISRCLRWTSLVEEQCRRRFGFTQRREGAKR